MSHLAYVFSCPQAVCLLLGLHGQVWTSTSVWLLALTWQLSQMTSGGIIRRWLGLKTGMIADRSTGCFEGSLL